MSYISKSIYSRFANRVKKRYQFIFRTRGKTIYHCCIQKSGSQWFKKIFLDDIFWKHNKLALHSPTDNFITNDSDLLIKLGDLPKDVIVSPLYIRYKSFVEMQKPKNYKTFFIARDPRDLIISNYFSLKFSHDPYHPYILKMRKRLNSLTQEDGLSEIINTFTPGTKQTLEGWFKQNSVHTKLIKFEDIFGSNQIQIFTELLNHLEIKLAKDDIANLLKKYSFKKISGRNVGTEDVKHHYRKGEPGDWKNYFTTEHNDSFKKLSGDLLILCGYEKDNNW